MTLYILTFFTIIGNNHASLTIPAFYGLHNGSTRGADQIRGVKSRASIRGELMVGAFPSFLAGFHMAYKIEKQIAKATFADFCWRSLRRTIYPFFCPVPHGKRFK
jgi:hypothetical protein